MKLKDLFEMPDFLNKEMPIVDTNTLHSYSISTVNREFDIIGKNKLENIEYWSILKKDKSLAVIGKLSPRVLDGDLGLEVLGQLDFKDSPDFAFDRLVEVNNKVLQVDSVEVFRNKFRDIGFTLYSSLVEYGYIIVSDHTQYIGGRKLWEKIARRSFSKNYSVYIVNNGIPVEDENGKPLEYDGTNLADDKIWGEPTANIANSKRYVLLAMKRK